MHEAPAELIKAINSALTVLSWFENLPSEEIPPALIWCNEERLDGWWAAQKQNRARKASGQEEIPTEGMMQNAAFKKR